MDVQGGWGAQPILQSEQLLLCNTLSCLSAFLALAAPAAPFLSSMASQLLSLLLSTRFHSHPAVRRITLVALLRLLLFVPQPVLLQAALSAPLQEMRQWAAGREREGQEADAECRQLAMMCRAEMDDRMGRELLLRDWAEEAQGGDADSLMRLVVPGAATLSSASSVPSSSMLKFL